MTSNLEEDQINHLGQVLERVKRDQIITFMEIYKDLPKDNIEKRKEIHLINLKNLSLQSENFPKSVTEFIIQ